MLSSATFPVFFHRAFWSDTEWVVFAAMIVYGSIVVFLCVSLYIVVRFLFTLVFGRVCPYRVILVSIFTLFGIEKQ